MNLINAPRLVNRAIRFRRLFKALSTASSRTGWLVAVDAAGPVSIEPEWSDTVVAWINNTRFDAEDIVSEKLSSVVSNDAQASLRVTMPQRADLHASSRAGDVRVSGKIEGDVTVNSDAGDVRFDGSIKGATVAAAAARRLLALRAIESLDATLAGDGGVDALRISAARVRVESRAGDVRVGAIYSADAQLRVEGSGRLGVSAIHGAVRVAAPAAGARVSLRGITGSVNVSAGDRPIFLHFDSPRGSSAVDALGDVSVTMNAPVAVRVAVTAAKGATVLGEIARGGTFSGLVRILAEKGAAAGGSGGGSGKIREGAAITGFYEEPGLAASAADSDAAAASISIRSAGTVSIRVVDYAEAAMMAAAERAEAAGA
jgi:hypothetical protein